MNAPPPSDEAVQRPVRAWDLVRRRSFGSYLVGNSISAAGLHFQTIAQSLLMYRLTGSTFLVGVTVFAQFIGVFVCAPFSGAAADRFDRKRLLMLLIGTSGALNTVMAVLVAMDALRPASLLAFVLAAGLLHSFTQPVLQSLVPQLVEPHELKAGVSFSNTSFTIARTLGPIAAAGIIAAWGLAAAFAVNAATYVVFIGALLVIRPRPVPRSDGESAGFRAGLSLARRTPAVMSALVALGGIVMVTEPINTIAPELVTSAYGSSDALVGVLLGAFGAGATCAGILLGRFRSSPSRGMAGGFVAVAIGLVGLGASVNVATGFLALFVVGGGYLHCVTTGMTVLLSSTPPDQHGRIMAIWSLAFFGSRPLAAVISGAIASLTSVRVTALVLAGAAVALGGWIARRLGDDAPPPTPAPTSRARAVM